MKKSWAIMTFFLRVFFFFFKEWSYTGVELVLTKKLQTVNLNNIKDCGRENIGFYDMHHRTILFPLWKLLPKRTEGSNRLTSKGNYDFFFNRARKTKNLTFKLAVNLTKRSHTQIKQIHPLKMIYEILPQCFSAYAVFRLCIYIYICSTSK